MLRNHHHYDYHLPGRIKKDGENEQNTLTLKGRLRCGDDNDVLLALSSIINDNTITHNLTRLDLSRNKLCTLSVELAKYIPRLQYLNLSFNCLQTIPDVVLHLTGLQELDLSRNYIQGSLPDQMPRSLSQLQSLKLAGNMIEGLPLDMSDWAGNLCTLLMGSECVGGNHLDRLPPSVAQLLRLRELDVFGNRLSVLDASVLGCLPWLERLSLQKNLLVEIIDPSALCKLRHLRTLTLSQNKLRRLPDELCRLDGLELIDLSNNLLEELSAGMDIFLRSRSTLLAGNPFDRPATASSRAGLSTIKQQVLPLMELAARAVLANSCNNSNNWCCDNQLPERLHQYLSQRGGRCNVCQTTAFIREFSSELIRDPSFLGFPNVSRRIKICSMKCQYRWSRRQPSSSLQW